MSSCKLFVQLKNLFKNYNLIRVITNFVKKSVIIIFQCSEFVNSLKKL